MMMISGDTTLTKVFVGGLAWETPNDALKEHFQQYGNILEAIVIHDKTTGRSKGYGFVTFNEPESAKKACEDPAPLINGRRANCNLAYIGARQQRSSSIVPPNQNGTNVNVVPRSAGTTVSMPPVHVPWYNQQTMVPYYGYGPATYYGATDVSYNNKLGYMGGAYVNGGHYAPLYPGQAVGGYHMHNYHQTGSMGFPAHLYSKPKTSAPVVISKPIKITPTPGPVVRG